MERTIHKVVAYAPRMHETDDAKFNSRKIKLVFTDGTVKTFYQGIDKAYNLIASLMIDKLIASDYTRENHPNAIRPYVKYIVKE